MGHQYPEPVHESAPLFLGVHGHCFQLSMIPSCSYKNTQLSQMCIIQVGHIVIACNDDMRSLCMGLFWASWTGEASQACLRVGDSSGVNLLAPCHR